MSHARASKHNMTRKGTILIVDDEFDSATVTAVRRGLDEEGWDPVVVRPEANWSIADEFEAAAIYAIEERQPDGVLLDVRFGDQAGERFKGLDILQRIVERFPGLPVLMFTQYAQGPDRDTAVRGALTREAPVDFIDKLASPGEVVLRLRRLIGTSPSTIPIGSRPDCQILVNKDSRLVYAGTEGRMAPVHEIQGMKFEIFRELAEAWYHSPGELVTFGRLERYSDGEDPRASLRVRIREIKVALGRALGVRFSAGELIINARDQGYRLLPPSI